VGTTLTQVVDFTVHTAFPVVAWNLDKNRPNVGYAATVAASCNP